MRKPEVLRNDHHQQGGSGRNLSSGEDLGRFLTQNER